MRAQIDGKSKPAKQQRHGKFTISLEKDSLF